MNNLTPPDGMEIDLEKSNIVFKPMKKKKSWKDFGEVRGYFISSFSTIIKLPSQHSEAVNRNTIPTLEEAEAILALIQLIQWRDKYNEGWKAEWEEVNYKHVIYSYGSELRVDFSMWSSRPLTFKTQEIAKQFLEDFHDLIMKARPVL